VVKFWSNSREQRWQQVAKGRPSNGMVEANGEAWKLVAKATSILTLPFSEFGSLKTVTHLSFLTPRPSTAAEDEEAHAAVARDALAALITSVDQLLERRGWEGARRELARGDG
jgi:hypothetical protein